MKIHHVLTFMLASLALCIFLPVHAQDNLPDDMPLMAVVIDYNLWLLGLDDEPVQITHYDADKKASFYDIKWSPDGNLLIFRVYISYDNRDLVIIDISSGTPVEVAVNFPISGDISFSQDSQSILYTIMGCYNGMEASLCYDDIYHREWPSGENMELLGRYEYEFRCGGTSVPAPNIYLQEIDYDSSFLEETPYGIIYVYCEEAWPDEAYNETPAKSIIELPADIRLPALSPDRTRLAGVRYLQQEQVYEIVIIDLQTNAATSIKSVEGLLMQLQWGDNNMLYYSTHHYTGNILDDYSAEQVEQFLSEQPYLSRNEMASYEVTLWELSIDDHSAKKLYQAEAYSIARIIPVPGAVIFSQIPNMHEWVAERMADTITKSDEYIEILPPHLYRLNLSDGDVELLGIGISKATVAPPFLSGYSE